VSRTIRPVALFVALAIAALPLFHGLAALARLVVPGAPAAYASSAACLAVCAAVAASRSSRARSWIVGGIAGALAAAALAFGFDDAGSGLTLLAIGPPIGIAARYAAALLPAELEARATRRPLIATAWMVLGLLSVGQTARISSFMTDDCVPHGPTIAGFWDHHMCLPAYLQAAEMNRDGEENVYHAAHYPGVTRDAQPTTHVPGMQHYVEDPYQYPPQFLLLPHALVASGLDYATLRALWFAAQALLFIATAIALARHVGEERGLRVLAWMPLVWIAPGTMFNFQYGQAHLAVLCVSLLGMLAFARGRDLAGAALLACAVLAKLFPALLLIPLAAQRRWKALGMTFVAAAAITLISLPVLGTAPYVSFFEYHLPRLLSGEAFAFQDSWPEVASELIASNQSVKGFVDKLALLGLPAALELKTVLSIGYVLAVLALASHASKRANTPYAQAVLWLGLLTLGALSSPGAWADYVLVSAIWMLAFTSAARPASRAARCAVAATWALLVLQPGVFPLVPVGGERGMLIAAALGHLVVLALCATQLIGRTTRRSARAEGAIPVAASS
jgi:glycosyl transferase family 87